MTKEVVSLKRELTRLKGLVYKDPLTGVYNRRGFLEETQRMFDAAFQAMHHKGLRKKFYVRGFSVILLDIDYFKRLNDSYGHDAGDAALKKLAEVLENNLRESDIVGRWGGEEFVVALVGANVNDAFRVAEHLRERVEETHITVKKKGFLITRRERVGFTSSFGVAGMGKRDTLEKLIKKADKAMYLAKKSGRNRVVRYK